MSVQTYIKWKPALGAALLLSSTHALSCSESPYLGAVCYTAATYCPVGYTEADGKELSITDNQALYSLLEFKYGGDGRTKFKVPDLRGRTVVGQGTGAKLTPRELGNTYGAETVELAIEHFPAHNHDFAGNILISEGQASIPVSTSSGNQVTPSGEVYLAASAFSDAIYTSTKPTGDRAHMPLHIPQATVHISGSTGSAGNGIPFPLSQPSLVLRACIAIQGQYPPKY